MSVGLLVGLRLLLPLGFIPRLTFLHEVGYLVRPRESRWITTLCNPGPYRTPGATRTPSVTRTPSPSRTRGTKNSPY